MGNYTINRDKILDHLVYFNIMGAVIQILLISLSLSMDSLSVSIASGMRFHKARIVHAVRVASFFAIFQAAMPVIGWLISEAMKDFIAAISHWVGFFLLGIIGIKMIRESLSNSRKIEKDVLSAKTLLSLAFITSIDALIVGITLNLLEIPVFVSIAVIGIVTFILCYMGFLFGEYAERLFGKKIEIAGGVALIIIGLKILIG